jgi:porphobilinogen synthase
VRDVVAEVGDDVVVMADLCLDEFTDHGHCGVTGTDGAGRAVVDNDATLVSLRAMARRRPTRAPTWWAPAG